jgi:hypothetical protein
MKVRGLAQLRRRRCQMSTAWPASSDGQPFGIFEELEATVLGAIEPEDNSFAEFDRLVLVSEFHPPLGVVEVGRYDVLDRCPGCF